MYNLLCYGLYTFCFTLKSCLSVGTLLISLLVFEIEEDECCVWVEDGEVLRRNYNSCAGFEIN